jgi:UrcA family protein
MLFRILAAPTAILVLSVGMNAARADDLDIVSTTVNFADLNLARPADDRILAQRLAEAAQSVCLQANPDASSVTLQSCTNAAIDLALAQIQDQLDNQVDAKLDVIRTSFAGP